MYTCSKALHLLYLVTATPLMQIAPAIPEQTPSFKTNKGRDFNYEQCCILVNVRFQSIKNPLDCLLPNWKEGNGGESNSSQRFLPFLRAETMVFPRIEFWKSEGEIPSITLLSSAMRTRLIFFPRQLSSIALLAASTSGSSGIVRIQVFGGLGALLVPINQSALSLLFLV